MNSPRLGVNIDHVATVRNARGEKYPSPLKAALLAKKFGADSITIHLREDRRHINDQDLIFIKKNLKIPLKYKPNFVCIVPEKRKEITTEGGLNLKYNLILIKKIIKRLKKSKIRVSLFIEPNIKDIKIAKKINADCVEIHVGKFCILQNKKKNTKKEFEKIKKSIHFANEIGLEAHAGHGITFSSAKILSRIKGIKEFNIGHFLIAESIFIGMKKCIKIFKKILKK
jgi:pyridoxine 5-phosphate synthase